jgi:hypothetical protein
MALMIVLSGELVGVFGTIWNDASCQITGELKCKSLEMSNLRLFAWLKAWALLLPL